MLKLKSERDKNYNTKPRSFELLNDDVIEHGRYEMNVIAVIKKRVIVEFGCTVHGGQVVSPAGHKVELTRIDAWVVNDLPANQFGKALRVTYRRRWENITTQKIG